MIKASPFFADFVRSQIKTPAVFCKVQLPTPDGGSVASQLLLRDITGVRITRNQDASADTCSITLPDDKGDMSSMNPTSKYGAAFFPGVIDKKFLLFLGFRGENFINNPDFFFNDQSVLLKFTGFLETDAQHLGFNRIDKTASLIDLNKQFRFPISDTFPHPLYGDQNSQFLDRFYNLTNPSGDGRTWVCPGKMFTVANSDKIYGSSHIDPALYIDNTGGLSPTSTPLSNTGWSITNSIGTNSSWTFDYRNGIATLPGSIPSNSVVSLAGNPTYMAPEDMIRNMLVNYALWSPAFINFDKSNVLLPMYLGEDKSLWDCIKEIASLTNPRFLPWVIWTDENGMIRFYETQVDGPPVKTLLDERDVLDMTYEFSSRQIRTVVRADATVLQGGGGSGGDQPITSIAYDVDNLFKYGQTEPYQIDRSLTQAVRNLSVSQAISYLNLLTASVLAQSSRPTLQVQAEIWPDPTLQISDKVRIRSKKTGIDREFLVSASQEDVGPGTYKQTLTLDEYYDAVNYMVGLPGGVTGDGTSQSSITAPPATSLIGAVRLGTGVGTYVFQNGRYAIDPTTGDQVTPIWDAQTSGTHFDVYLNSLPAVAQASVGANGVAYSYNNLPPGYNWAPQTAADGRTQVFYGTDTSVTPNQTVYVGPDSIFYRFAHAPPITAGDYNLVWTPPGNTTPPANGGTQTYTGQTSSTYLWQWWYLNLESNQGSGKFFRLVQRPNPSQDGQAIIVPSMGGSWINSTWNDPPGPALSSSPSYIYGNIAVGLTDYTAPPPGFVGANVMGDGVNLGVAFGSPIAQGAFYTGYRYKRVKGHYCVYAASSSGAVQFLRCPFWVYL